MSTIEISTNVLQALLQDISELKNRVAKLETNHLPAKQQPQKQASTSFWKAINAINKDDHLINHANNTDEFLGINLPELIQHCYTQGIELPPKKQLIRQIKRERNYVGNFSIRSRIKGSTVRCFLFKLS